MSDDDFGTRFRFVPSLRRGFGPTDPFSEGTPSADARPTMGIDITPEARKRPDAGGGWEEDDTARRVDLNVYGPGDVEGIDDAQITRVEPEPETRNFPPNYFPFVEFDRPGLPWRFSPEAADDDGRTRPWLTLVTVEDTEDVSVTVGGHSPCPVLELGSGVDIQRQLPDLGESWAWAHAQLQDNDDPDDWAGWAREELTSVSNVTASRLLSPRNLQPETEYIACVVPTFEAGRLAGLGREPYPDRSSDDGGDPPTLELAWNLESPPQPPFELPLYHYWRFRAGGEGTFESLVTNLTPVELGEDVGMKDVDVTDPGPDSLVPGEDEPTTQAVAGALYSAPAKSAVTDRDYGKQDRLRELLNKPETLPAGEASDYPVVGPPLYGKWHAGLDGIPPENIRDQYYDPAWFRELNLGVRHRIAASIGGEVVNEHQNQLMSAAWEVVGEIREANKMTKNVQGSAVIGDSLDNRVDGTDVSDEVDPSATLDVSARAWEIKSELDRIEKLGGLEVDDIVDSPLGEDVDPDEGTTQPPAGGEHGGQPVGGGQEPIAGDQEPVAGGGAVDPRNRVSTGYVLGGSDQPLLEEADGTIADGGAADTEGGGGTEGAAFFVEYLRSFSAQPQASLQYQRMVRRDGPLARRADLDDDYYDRVLEQVRDRTLQEIGTLADGLHSASGDNGPEDGDGSDGSGEEPETEGAAAQDGESEEPVGNIAAVASYEDAGESATRSARVGVAAPTRGQSRIGESIPLTSGVATAHETRSALDDRVPPGSAVEGSADGPGRWSAHGTTTSDAASTVPSDGEPAASVAALLSSLRDHATSARGRVQAARGDLSADEDPTGAVLAAYERAEPIAYGLDPLDRELSKAIADENVAVAPALDERRRAEAMDVLRDAYGSVLSILTTVYEALEDDDALTDGGTPGDGRSVLPENPTRSDYDDALATAEEELARFRGELEALRSLISTPDQLPSLSAYVPEDRPRPIDPRQKSTVTPTRPELDQRLEAGSSLRYLRGYVGQWLSWIDGRDFVRSEDPVTGVMAAPEFPTPMWRPLKEYDEEFLLPGAGEVPKGSVGLVVQNREFIESYMAGLSHEMGRELLWRNYPTDRKGTYFRRFWNKGKGPAWEVPGQGVSVDETPSKDIEEIHNWDESELGANAPGAGEESEPEKVVLLVRGELFRRYPNANVYAARARASQGENEDGEEIVEVKPMTPERFAERGDDDEDLQFPIFRGRIDPDITFLGFDLTVGDVYPDDENIRNVIDEGEVPDDGADLGWYFVFEERPGETRFGLEVPEDEHTDGRPVGIGTNEDPIFVPYDDDNDPKPIDVEPVGWDDVSWAHLVSDTSDLNSMSYVPVQESRPGKEEWAVPESATDPEYNGKASDLKDAVGRAFDEGDTAAWKKNSAHMARITWRKPARVSFHAMELLPDDPPRQD